MLRDWKHEESDVRSLQTICAGGHWPTQAKVFRLATKTSTSTRLSLSRFFDNWFSRGQTQITFSDQLEDLTQRVTDKVHERNTTEISVTDEVL